MVLTVQSLGPTSSVPRATAHDGHRGRRRKSEGGPEGPPRQVTATTGGDTCEQAGLLRLETVLPLFSVLPARAGVPFSLERKGRQGAVNHVKKKKSPNALEPRALQFSANERTKPSNGTLLVIT